MTPIDSAAWPAFRCHKVVRAVQITGLSPMPTESPAPANTALGTGPEPKRLFFAMVSSNPAHPAEITAEECFYDAPAVMFARGYPTIGDYLVLYDDGYVSISPKAAFEAGYYRQPTDLEAIMYERPNRGDMVLGIRTKGQTPELGWSATGQEAGEALLKLARDLMGPPQFIDGKPVTEGAK